MSIYEARVHTRSSILLGSGNYYDYQKPNEVTLTIEDYAASLAFECRYRGQCIDRSTKKRLFYSTAQHCVLGSYQIEPLFAYEFLMHESGEAVCGDMVSPLKRLCPDFKAIEKAAEEPIMRHFGVITHNPTLIKEVDLRMWITERNQMMNWAGEVWTGENLNEEGTKKIQPYDIIIEPLGPYEAYDLFMNRWKELTFGGIYEGDPPAP